MSKNNTNLNVVITGANRGIGLALCGLYKQSGANVIAVCRSSSKKLESMQVEVIDSVDVATEDGVAKLKTVMADRKVDILINNAGILRSQSFGNFDYENMLEQFKVNSLGPIRVTEALFDNLKSGSKIAMITSRMGSVEDNGSGGAYGYRMSKSALNIAGKSMAIDLKPKGIAVALLHPGYVQTDMTNLSGEISAELSAERLVKRIDDLNIDNTGTFWHSNGEVLPW